MNETIERGGCQRQQKVLENMEVRESFQHLLELPSFSFHGQPSLDLSWSGEANETC